MTVRHGLKTDLQELKTLAHCLLEIEPEKTDYSPVIIRHPFTDSGVVAMKNEDGSLRIGNIMEGEDDLRNWRNIVGETIDEADSAFSIYIRITKPYLLAFVKFAAPSLSKEDFTKMFADAWVRSEMPNHDPNISRKEMLSMFRSADPALLMDADELARLQELDDTVTVYRGVRSERPGSVKALSWTLSRETAQWFADRYGKAGTVYEATIDKKHIHALFLGRNESEVIVNPKYLTDITPVQELRHGAMTMEEM